jgi:lipoate-protein ligase A
VIGSAQSASDFDAEGLEAVGLDLVRRRSGGGAVLISPGGQVWLDVFVPSGDQLAHPDVGMSFYWLGGVFAAALANVLALPAGAGAPEVHRGRVLSTPWSKALCFAGLGAGEVSIAGRKVVGMSQRRERSGSWIHSVAVLSARAGDIADLLCGPAERRTAAKAVLDRSGLRDSEHLVGPLTEELLSRLP